MLTWTPSTRYPGYLCGALDTLPSLTLFLIEIDKADDELGRLSGSLIHDEEEDGDHLTDFIESLKGAAEAYTNDFLEHIHGTVLFDPEDTGTDCPMCHGKGELPQDPSYPNDPVENCPECLGAGVV